MVKYSIFKCTYQTEKKYVFKIFFQPWKISIEHNSGDGTEIRYFQIPSYPIPRNKWHKRGLPTHDSILNLCSFLLTQTVSRMIQGTIYIPLCTLAITYNPTPCSHGNKWYPQLGFESYSSRKDSMWRVVMEERATSLGMLKN